MSRPPKIVLVEAQALAASALRHALEPHFEIAGATGGGGERLDSALEELQPHAVVASLNSLSLDSIRSLRRSNAELRLLVYGDGTDVDTVTEVFGAGANAYLSADSEPAEFTFALQQIIAGRSYVTPAATETLVDRALDMVATPSGSVADGEKTDDKTIGLLIVDDHPIVRTGMQAILEQTPDFKVLGHAASGLEALEQTALLRPDIVLMDVIMPRLSGVEATRAICQQFSETRVLLISGLTGDEMLLEAVRAGAAGYVAKSFEADEIQRAVRAVFRGQTYLNQEITRGLLELTDVVANPPPPLTERELDISRLVAEGLANQQIAKRLFVSEGTVRTHLRHVFEKLGISNRVELALYAMRAGWVSIVS